ncbi:LysR family transcriptional regulator [Roseiterribacter gracilis]|uniref:Transcriptional regulator n=1 Tax=Roseiterribacter gracilis TaxID=2812848 RepID=A0A8S8XG58_9PROT|nr:transcriptional regulator [Rhodospirillales bacterium TMPK1]
MEMHQVRYFLAVARTLNFTRAAEDCNVTQPSLTRAIQKLEEELGGLLFRRERALTHLTDLGRAVQPHLQRTFDAAEAAKALADHVKRADVVPLALGVVDALPVHELVEPLRHLDSAIGGLELTLATGAQATLLEDAMHGDLDALLITHVGDLPERVESWTLAREPILVLLRADDPLASRESISLDALRGTSWIECGACPTRRAFVQLAEERGVALAIRHRAAGEAQVQLLVAAGLGRSLIGAFHPLRDGLVTRPFEDVQLDRALAVATVAGRRRSAAADAFVRAARARAWGVAA